MTYKTTKINWKKKREKFLTPIVMQKVKQYNGRQLVLVFSLSRFKKKFLKI